MEIRGRGALGRGPPAGLQDVIPGGQGQGKSEQDRNPERKRQRDGEGGKSRGVTELQRGERGDSGKRDREAHNEEVAVNPEIRHRKAVGVI